MNKQEVEKIILDVVEINPVSLTPKQMRLLLESAGIDGGEVKNAIARLSDNGKLTIDTDMNIKLSHKPKHDIVISF